jgi:hypothetical protein
MKRKFLLSFLAAASGIFATNLAQSLDWQKTSIPDTATYGPVVSSVDGGATWAENAPPGINWTSLAISADGYQIVASAGPTPLTFVGNGIYTSKSVPVLELSIAPEGTNLLLSWTTPSTSFVLQQSSDPVMTNWTDVPVQPILALTNLAQQARVAPTASRDFYRLRSY